MSKGAAHAGGLLSCVRLASPRSTSCAVFRLLRRVWLTVPRSDCFAAFGLLRRGQIASHSSVSAQKPFFLILSSLHDNFD